MLQAVAAIASLAVLLWSLGVPSLRFAEAANVTQFSDTLSTSQPSVGSDHTIVFTTPTGLTAGQTIVITFDSGFVLGALGAEDIDFATTSGEFSLQNGAAAGAVWGVSSSSNSLTLTSGSGILAANATVTLQIGLLATTDTNGDTQIVNPTNGSYPINVNIGAGTDTGETRVAIIDVVTVTASVDTQLDFQVGGIPQGFTVNGTTTTGSSSATAIPFGELDPGVASTAAQELTVETNARNGFVVTVIADQQLESATGADIDSFANGNNESSPTLWSAPLGTVGTENTYGHWGVTTDDATTGAGLTDQFADQQYVAVSTSTPVEVFRHDGPSDGTGASTGSTTVAYTVQITSLQEAGDDYQAILTYVATPVF
jgi:hypothetical protein